MKRLIADDAHMTVAELINQLLIELRVQEARIAETKWLINELCKKIKKPIIFPEIESLDNDK